MIPDPRAGRDPLAEARRPERVDLDAVQARYDRGQFSSDPAVAFAAIDDVPELVTELRAAREVLAVAWRCYRGRTA